ncbi:MAG: hypothetical protein KHZ99_18690 [Clostridium sp.]|uniref:hypothetical protein n=1 Tax=Clostridium TaxID=1485 RepID=UPI00115A9E03|nr:hypothetical protein [Clostridium sp.]MBS4959028.1 hypothetical protein [Clostridium sp.]MDU2158858.1 hypothetical protein [Clostridium sp.]
MEYLTLKTGNILTILIPINLIFSKVVEFIKIYTNKKVEIIFRCCTVSFAIISTITFYILDYSIYFCFTWIGSLLIGLLQYSIAFRNINKEDYKELNQLQQIFSFIGIIIGAFLVVLPYTKIFILIGGGYELKVDNISRVVFLVCGICFIMLSKYIINKIKSCDIKI